MINKKRHQTRRKGNFLQGVDHKYRRKKLHILKPENNKNVQIKKKEQMKQHSFGEYVCVYYIPEQST